MASSLVLASVLILYLALSVHSDEFLITGNKLQTVKINVYKKSYKGHAILFSDEHLDSEFLVNSFANSLVNQVLSKTSDRFANQNRRNSERGSLIPPDLIGVLPNIPLPNGTLRFDNLLLSGSYAHGLAVLYCFDSFVRQMRTRITRSSVCL